MIGAADLTFVGRQPCTIQSLAEIFGKFPNANIGGLGCSVKIGNNCEGLQQVSFGSDYEPESGKCGIIKT